MYYPTTPAELWFFLFFLTAAFAATFCIIGYAIYKAVNRGKAWIITVPETPGALGELERRRLTRGEFTKKLGKDGDVERIIASDQAHIPTKKGPIWLIGQSTGWNLVAPSKTDAPLIYDLQMRANGGQAQAAPHELYARMLVADPLAYERAIEQNDYSDYLNSKQDKDPWQVRIAGLIAVVLLLALGILGGVGYLITNAQGA